MYPDAAAKWGPCFMNYRSDADRHITDHATIGVENSGGDLVTVIIPAYNAAMYIGETLESVFRQTHSNYEVIVVNDGSPDSRALELALLPFLSRITYLKQDNCGPSGARNTGIMKARGKYLAFLDSDDYWLPRHLEKQVALFKRDPTLDLVYADCVLLQNNLPIGSAFDFEPQSSPVTFRSLVSEHCTISTSSAVASRQFILDVGLFDESLSRCEDYDLWLRMAHRGARINYNRDPQLCHRRYNNLSSDCLLMDSARVEVYNKLLTNLALSDKDRTAIKNRIAHTQVEYFTEVVKRSLVNRDYGEAIEAATRAISILSNWKLRLVVAGLATSPKIFWVAYKGYEFLLRLRDRRRTAKRVRRLQRYIVLNSGLPTVAELRGNKRTV